MEITGKIENGKLTLPSEIIEELGLEEGYTLTLECEKNVENVPSEEDKQNALKLIGLLDKYRKEDTPSVSIEDMEKGIAKGANRGRFDKDLY